MTPTAQRHRFALLLAVPILAAAAPSLAQDEDPLVGDRPDFTESAITIAPGRFQVEAGITHTDGDDADVLDVGELLVRIGLTERLELRLGVGSYVSVEPRRGPDESGFADPSIGVKIGLGEAGGWTTALLAGTSFDVGSSDVGESDPQPQLVLAAQRDLSARWSLGANLGYAYASGGGEQFGEVSASVAAGLALGERTGVFFELFGIVPSNTGGPETYFFDAGLTWALGPDLQLDLRAGVGLNSAAQDFFAGAGVVWRR